MSRNRIEDFGPYQDAIKLFDHVVEDMEILRKDFRCFRLIGQQIGSADSICANMEEGFGRLSRTEYIRFLDIARGSARETHGRYKRMKHWLSEETIEARVEIADRIIARLTKSINTLRANNVSAAGKKRARNSTPDTPGSSSVHENPASYGVSRKVNQDLITDKQLDELLQLD